jgi:hypothetical protein
MIKWIISEKIRNHPLKGAIFENFVVTELLKARTNHGKNRNAEKINA